MNLVPVLVVAALSLAAGIGIGLHIQTRQMKDWEARMENLMGRLKKANNEMLSSFSYAYHKSTDTEGEFTDIDEEIMGMWMDD